MTKLTQIRTPGGVPFTVAADYAPRFQAFLAALEEAGYQPKADQSGGYNPRTIAGTNTPSQHAYGRAIDINWTDNPRGGQGQIPTEVARALAQKHGLKWGGDWSNPDPMHFEVADAAPVPMGQRGITSYAGLPGSSGPVPGALAAGASGPAIDAPASSAAASSAPSAADAITASSLGEAAGGLLAGWFGGGNAAERPAPASTLGPATPAVRKLQQIQEMGDEVRGMPMEPATPTRRVPPRSFDAKRLLAALAKRSMLEG